MEFLLKTPADFKPVNLRCEYRISPPLVGTGTPRLSWSFGCMTRGQRQTAYRILAASSPRMLREGRADLWDSGCISSGRISGVAYAGRELKSGQDCFWCVRCWDKDARPGPYSDTARFRVGLLNPEDWKAGWIAHPSHKRGLAPMFRRAFTADKKVARAVAYVCGLGYCELSVNGKKTGDSVLDPGWTDYRRRVLYTAHDVTGLLKIGLNVVGILLGEGWHGNEGQCQKDFNGKSVGWVDAPKLLFQLYVEYVDGSGLMILSGKDTGWQVSTGPIVENSIYDGETYDACLEKPGWDSPEAFRAGEGNGGDWLPAAACAAPGGVLAPQTAEPIRVMHDIAPVKVTCPKENTYIIDMGQNFAGWVRLRVKGRRGDRVVLKFAEELSDDGTLYMATLRNARCTDTYILKGRGTEIYEPRFTYHGFRYVQAEGLPEAPGPGTVTGRAVYSSLENTGGFFCGDPLLNRIHQNIVWTERSNLHSVPTDCPQRDERMGWLNDATVRIEEAVYNFDMTGLYPKWMDDIEDARDPETGAIADTAPFVWGSLPADYRSAVPTCCSRGICTCSMGMGKPSGGITGA